MAEPFARPVAVVSPQYCTPYSIDLAIVKNPKTLADSNFAVTDVNGNVTFKVTETEFLKRRNIFDAAGNHVVTLQRKARSAHSRWQVFRGGSTDPKDLIFNAKEHSIFDLKTKLDVFLASNTAEKVCDFRLTGSFTSHRSCVVYAGDKHSKTIVAQMQKKHKPKSTLLGKCSSMVTVYPNIDYAFIVALIFILDAINQEANIAAANAGAASANAARANIAAANAGRASAAAASASAAAASASAASAAAACC